jgi:ankyrin repeat protein
MYHVSHYLKAVDFNFDSKICIGFINQFFMTNRDNKEELFRLAVQTMDAGDIIALEKLLQQYPWLACEPLDTPAEWLREQVGKALDGFFKDPYLLWFVTEDPIRNRTLPANVIDIARLIIRIVKEQKSDSLQDQLDYAVKLTGWSSIAKQCGVQLSLINLFLDEGATPSGPNDALVCGNMDAAKLLVERGAPLTLAAALCFGQMEEARQLASISSADEKQASLVLAALNGCAAGVAELLPFIENVNLPSQGIYSHATPLHHAVCSGSLEAVKALVNAGADTTIVDTAWKGKPVDWALYYYESAADKEKYKEIVNYFRGLEKKV